MRPSPSSRRRHRGSAALSASTSSLVALPVPMAARGLPAPDKELLALVVLVGGYPGLGRLLRPTVGVSQPSANAVSDTFVEVRRTDNHLDAPSRIRSRTASLTRAKAKEIPWLCSSLMRRSNSSQPLVSTKSTEPASRRTRFAGGRRAAPAQPSSPGQMARMWRPARWAARESRTSPAWRRGPPRYRAVGRAPRLAGGLFDKSTSAAPARRQARYLAARQGSRLQR